MTCRLRTNLEGGGRDGVCASEAAALRIVGNTRHHHHEVREDDSVSPMDDEYRLRREREDPGVMGSSADDRVAEFHRQLRDTPHGRR
jgi:hypothetical protein